MSGSEQGPIGGIGSEVEAGVEVFMKGAGRGECSGGGESNGVSWYRGAFSLVLALLDGTVC